MVKNGGGKEDGYISTPLLSLSDANDLWEVENPDKIDSQKSSYCKQQIFIYIYCIQVEQTE